MKKNSFYKISVRAIIAVLIVAMLSTSFIPIVTFANNGNTTGGSTTGGSTTGGSTTGGSTTGGNTTGGSTTGGSTTGGSTTGGSTTGGSTTGGSTTGKSNKPAANAKPAPKDPTPEEKEKLVKEELYTWASKQAEKRKEEETKEKLEKAEQALNIINDSLPGLVDMFSDMADGGSFDTAACLSTITDLACGILSCISPWGTVASAGLKLAMTVVNLILGGQEGPSPEALMEDRLTERIDAISDQICEVQNQIAELSNQVAEAADRIIAAIPTALENQDDKNRMIDFMLSSGTTDFSYNQLRNYIYGSLEENRNADTAYYSAVINAQLFGGSSEEIKYYYDKLYGSLMESRTSFHDYVIGDQFGKSIVATYYDLIKTRPDLLAEQGKTAEMAAVEFAYNLYQTELMMDQIILSCNNYQYAQMVFGGTTSYNYGTGIVYKTDILNAAGTNKIAQSLYQGVDDLRVQFAKDIAYIMNTTGSFTVCDDGEYDYRVTREEEGALYADVLEGQTVYFNRISDTILERFDLDATDFVYSGRGLDNAEGVVTVTNLTIASSYQLQYHADDGDIHSLGTVTFNDANYCDFIGGKGTVEDPYLIGTAAQFMSIGDGLDKYYQLICDIDLGDREITPFGFDVNDNNTQTFKEFTGCLDGHGYTVSNLKIRGVTNTGLFGVIGKGGIVQNITFSDFEITGSISYTNGTSSTYTGGIVAGTNNGIIESVTVKDSSLVITSNTSNEGAERNVFFKYGGVSGTNGGEIYAVKVDNTKVEVTTKHTFGGAEVDNNQNLVYVGGVCGTCEGKLSYAYVTSSVTLKADVTSTLSPKNTVRPYLYAVIGGITTNDGLADAEKNDTLGEQFKALYSEAKTGNANVKIKYEDSRWGKSYKNTKEKFNSRIPYLKSANLDKLTGTLEEINAEFYSIPVYDVVITDKTEAYEVGATELKKENLEITVDGKTVENVFLINTYGFNSYNESYTDNLTQDVFVMFLATIDGEKVLLRGDFTVTIGTNKATELHVVNYESYYKKGDRVATTATIEVTDANGETEMIPNAKVTVENAAAATATLGTKNIVVSYGGVSTEVEIEVMCNIHMTYYDYDNPDHYTNQGTVAATCLAGGYDLYTCNTCGYEVKQNQTPIADHAVVREVSREATCTETGIVGKIYCSSCNTVFQEQAVIPQLQHEVVNTGDANNHTCKNCNHQYAHEYVVSESIVNGRVTYTYTCSACGYVGVKNDTNIITYEERLRPAVVVSNGYALNPGDLVTVYVDLENNPGVNGANFGIRYTEGLELVGWYEGTFFQDTLGASNSVSCGVNFSWGTQTTLNAEGGNLLRLVFRIPYDAERDAEYTVSVVYSTVAGSEGGFALPANICAQLQISSSIPQKFITKDGVIRLVDRMPGDINNDELVNLMDALYLSNCLVNETDYPITEEVKEFGDVNLVGGVNINDVTKLLQSIAGGYGASLLSPNYQIMLNTNGYTEYDPGILGAQLYGTGNTYAALEVIEQYMQQRVGYEFLGWFTRLEGGKKVEYSDFIKYDEDQKIQTLYAHWEKNTVSFEMNGATSNPLTTESYTENGAQFITLVAPEEKYEVTFVDPTNPENNVKRTMTHSFAYWQGSDGVKYYVGDSFPVHRANMGNFTLTAVWGEWSLDIPALEKPGYDASQITWYTKNTNGLLENPLGENPCETIKALENKILYGKWTKPITYQVIYNGNGATSGSVPATTHNYGVDVTLSGNMNPGFVREPVITYNYGYDGKSDQVKVPYLFGGWSKVAVNGAITNELVQKDWPTVQGSTVTVYAQWIGQPTTLIKPADRKGYNFDGWYDPNGNLVGYTGPYTPTANITLTAKWSLISYTVTLDPNGGSVSPSIIDGIYYGQPYSKLPTPARYGFHFAGWKISGTTTIIWNETAVPLAQDHKLEAQWTPNTVTFNANGGSCSTTSNQLNASAQYQNLPTPTRTNYAFVGWFYGDTKVTNGTTAAVNGNHTLTAKWTSTYYLLQWRAGNSGARKVTDNDQVYDYAYPSFDIATLKSLGYTKIRITVSYNVKEEDKGYQELWITTSGGQVGYNEIEHGGSKLSTSWGNYVYQTTYDISKAGTDGYVRLEWGANGDGGDDWYVGDTIVKLEVIK